MTNHPNRKKLVYPWDFREEWREVIGRGADQLRLLWEERGPKNTSVAWMSCWATPFGVYIVQTWAEGGRSLFCETLEIKRPADLEAKFAAAHAD